MNFIKELYWDIYFQSFSELKGFIGHPITVFVLVICVAFSVLLLVVFPIAWAIDRVDNAFKLLVKKWPILGYDVFSWAYKSDSSYSYVDSEDRHND